MFSDYDDIQTNMTRRNNYYWQNYELSWYKFMA
jgi:hypothetical protein